MTKSEIEKAAEDRHFHVWEWQISEWVNITIGHIALRRNTITKQEYPITLEEAYKAAIGAYVFLDNPHD